MSSAAEWLSALAVLGAAASYAAAGLLVRRSRIPPTEGACWAFVLSVPMLLPFALVEWSVQTPDGRALIALLALGAASTGLATVMYFWLIAQAGPARALWVTYCHRSSRSASARLCWTSVCRCWPRWACRSS